MEYKQCCIDCKFHFFDEDECPNCWAKEFLDEFTPTCEVCGREMGHYEEVYIPWCHCGQEPPCDERFHCEQCMEDFKCRKVNEQLDLVFSHLPF